MPSDKGGDDPASLFRSVRAPRLSSQIADELRQAISTGRLQPGDRLPSERELVIRYQVSRTTIREATRMLEMAGLVAVKPGSGGGAFVTKPDFELVSRTLHTMFQANHFDVGDLYQARRMIEPGVAELAARGASPADVAALRRSIESGRELALRGERMVSASRVFHFALAKATKNDLLIMIVSSLMDLADRAEKDLHPPRPPALVLGAHESLADALERHDAAEARRLAEIHLEDMREGALASRRQRSQMPDAGAVAGS